MKPRTKYKMTVLGLSAAGVVFLGAGIYAMTSLTLGTRSHPSLLFGGASAFFLGLTSFWHAVQWARPLKEKLQNNPGECPNCGALIEEDATFCQKCKTQITG